MINYLNEIAVLGNENRRNAILCILDSIGIDYKIIGNTTKNIVVSFNPTNERLVIGAHYDAFYYGANDNAAACVILLNLIKDLKSTNKSIDFVFFDKEEAGGVGSREYISIVGKNKIKGMINLDMCGMGNNILLTYDKIGKALFDFKCMEDIISDSHIQVLSSLPFGDYNCFVSNNIPSIFIINSTDKDIAWFKGNMRIYPDFARTMHQKTDTPDTFSDKGMITIYEFLKRKIVN